MFGCLFGCSSGSAGNQAGAAKLSRVLDSDYGDIDALFAGALAMSSIHAARISIIALAREVLLVFGQGMSFESPLKGEPLRYLECCLV